MTEQKSDDILATSFEVFARHGFRRTTMSDLAEAAGMSRPNLYTKYKNKEDIFRAVSSRRVRGALDRGIAALQNDGHWCDRLLAGFLAWHGDFIELFELTPHARELLDTNHAVASDTTQQASESFCTAARTLIDDRQRSGDIELSRAGVGADDLVRVITDVSNGVKHTLEPLSVYRDRMTNALRVLDSALRPIGSQGWVPDRD